MSFLAIFLAAIQPGRLLRLRGTPGHGAAQDTLSTTKDPDQPTSQDTNDKLDWGWGVVVNLHKRAASKAGELAKYQVDVLVMCEQQDSPQEVRPPTPATNGAKVDEYVGLPCCTSHQCASTLAARWHSAI